MRKIQATIWYSIITSGQTPYNETPLKESTIISESNSSKLTFYTGYKYM